MSISSLLSARDPKLGYWGVVVGVGLQLLGISWDALLHHNNPELSGMESVFSLTNPSHVFILAGMALAVVGAAWGIAPGFKFRKAGTAAIVGLVLLVTLSGATSAIAIVTGGISGSHAHQDEEGGEHGHALDGQLLEVEQRLEDVVRKQGMAAALDELNRQAQSNTLVNGGAHQIVHALGRFSYGFYGNATKAFGECRQDFQAGCYHGVLEEYLTEHPGLRRDGLKNLCDGQILGKSAEVVKFQCVHGLGHGLSLHFNHNLMKTLHFCDALATDWDRSSCYGGAFMENIIFAQAPKEVHDGHDSAEHQIFLSRDDPLYPCNTLAQKYLFDCYQMQTSAILWHNGYDFKDAFKKCEGAPADFVTVCFRSMGRDIAGLTQLDATAAMRDCKSGPRRAWPACFGGVVSNMIDVSWMTDVAFDFCKRLPGREKRGCYVEIGEQVHPLFITRAERAAECAKAPRAYVKACRSGAQLNFSA
ncbi:MAG: hypothetical protein LC808_24715 [Actinobacteria bacterium]|nr:hypothetical protein [Actinomycetota bacterium]